jgi:diguanylate cyclase (GGDEF)-like protein
MQTLNVLDNRFTPFHTLNSSPADRLAAKQMNDAIFCSKRILSLVELFNTTLDLTVLFESLSIEASRYIDFSGLFFKSKSINKVLEGSRKSKLEHRFELKIGDTFIGTLTYGINSPISITNTQLLERLHKCLLYPLKNAISYYDAIQLAMQDSLTSLGNRRYFDEQIQRAMHNADRHHSLVGLVLGDLNKFKAINDTYGHAIGDQVLVEFAKILRLCTRDSDSLFRFGGDEFAILVENADENGLIIIENRITNALKQNNLLSKYKLGCSLGTTIMNGADDKQSLFNRADRALYRKKVYSTQHLSMV